VNKDTPDIQFTDKFCSRHVLAYGFNTEELCYVRSHLSTRCSTCNIGREGAGLPEVTPQR
jgi:hypothetical protein